MQQPYTEIVDQQADFTGWQEAHNLGIGASEVATVLGLNPWKTRLQLWAEKTGRTPPDETNNREAAEWGLLLEPVVADRYMRQTERVLERMGVLLRSNVHPWALATPDYWCVDIDGPAQIKTTSAYRLKDWAEGPPETVRIQVHAEMLVTGAARATVGVLVGGQRFMWADVDRDEVLMQRIIDAGREFWQMVQDDEWPDPTEDDGQLVTAMYPEAVPHLETRLPEEAVEWDQQLTEAKRQLKHWTAVKERYEAALKLAIGDATIALMPDGSGYYTFQNQHRSEHTVKASDFRVLRRSTV